VSSMFKERRRNNHGGAGGFAVGDQSAIPTQPLGCAGFVTGTYPPLKRFAVRTHPRMLTSRLPNAVSGSVKEVRAGFRGWPKQVTAWGSSKSAFRLPASIPGGRPVGL